MREFGRPVLAARRGAAADGRVDTFEDAPREPLAAAASTTFVWALTFLTALALLSALALSRASKEPDPAEAVQHL